MNSRKAVQIADDIMWAIAFIIALLLTVALALN
jgi:hypothetical protein